MNLLAVERIKLFSTRSPWWCMVVALALTVGFSALLASLYEGTMSITATQSGSQLGLMVVMVLAALSVTTEYRFGTIRSTFLAVPGRTPALLAKTAVVGILALLIGEVAAFGSLGVSGLFASDSDLAFGGAADWRQVAGVGLVYMLGAVLAVGVGILLRQSAGAITLLLLWPLLVEGLVTLIPRIGVDLGKWMPFSTTDVFLQPEAPVGAPLGPWGSLGYFAVVACGVLIAGLVTAKYRDA